MPAVFRHLINYTGDCRHPRCTVSQIEVTVKEAQRHFKRSFDITSCESNNTVAVQCFNMSGNTQMWMNALKTTEDAVKMPLVPMYLTATTALVIPDTPAMVLPVQVRLSLTVICFYLVV